MLELKKFLKEQKKKIRYVKKTHEYFAGDYKLTSVTQFLDEITKEQGEEPFNALKVATEISKNENSKYFGLEPRKILSLWSKKANYGTKKHKQVENGLNDENFNFPDKQFFIDNNLNKDNTITEILVFDVELGLSGRFDLAEVKDNVIYIHDVKTSDPITEGKIEHYSQQILVYSILLNRMLKKSGLDYTVKPGKIIHIKPKYDILDESMDFNNMEDFCYPEFIDVRLTKYDVTLVKNVLNKRKLFLKNKGV